MKKQIGNLIFVFAICIICLATPIVGYANSPAPARSISVEITNNHEAAVFADLLIKIDQSSPEYTDFNYDNGHIFTIAKESSIVQYAENGFASFTFHYLGAVSNINLAPVVSGDNRYLYADFTNTVNDDEQFRNVLANYHIIKIALLDKYGDIIQISEELDINPNKPGYFTGILRYDAASALAEAGYHFSPFIVLINIFLALFVIIRIIISISIELALAILYKIKPVWKVVMVNIATQIFLVIFLTFCRLPYVQALIIAEFIVYISEFGAYSVLFKDISKLRLAFYTITANTASLVIGLLLNTYKF